MLKQKRSLILGTTALLLTTVAVTGVGLRLARSQGYLQDNPKELVDEVWQIVNRTYVDGTFNGEDWVAVRQDYLTRDYKNQEEAYTAIREMLEKLNDPYTRFMSPDEFQSMRIDTSGELTGWVFKSPRTRIRRKLWWWLPSKIPPPTTLAFFLRT